jgi:putative transposase
LKEWAAPAAAPRGRPLSCGKSQAASGAKYDKAVECLTKDRDALLALYDFPAEHRDHLRTTNPIKSVLATVRHERLVVINHCQVDGVQAALRRIEDLAAAERHKSVAEGRHRCQI